MSQAMRNCGSVPGAVVFIVGSGGWSHPLEGKRAGVINPDFDCICLGEPDRAPGGLADHIARDLVRYFGSQGVELLDWPEMRGTLTGRVTERSRNYRIPISNTAAATTILKQDTEAATVT